MSGQSFDDKKSIHKESPRKAAWREQYLPFSERSQQIDDIQTHKNASAIRGNESGPYLNQSTAELLKTLSDMNTMKGSQKNPSNAQSQTEYEQYKTSYQQAVKTMDSASKLFDNPSTLEQQPNNKLHNKLMEFLNKTQASPSATTDERLGSAKPNLAFGAQGSDKFMDTKSIGPDELLGSKEPRLQFKKQD